MGQTSATFDFDGFSIPEELAVLTGGGGDSWAHIVSAHLSAYERYCPIGPGQRVLEVGCGVGRDAIPLSQLLGPDGRYIGVDIIEPSIAWCQANITPRRPNTRFEHLDVRNAAYNPAGSVSAVDVCLPVEDGWADRIVLQSVFTHMFSEEIDRYLSEFRRILAPDGRVFATFFVTDRRTLRTAHRTGAELEFRYRYGKGCRICDPANPPGAVGYTPAALNQMLRRAGLVPDEPVHRGFWSGRKNASDGQDIAVLRRSS